MLRILGKIPQEICIAVSGGADSMAVLSFLHRRNPVVVYFNHGTQHGSEAEVFLRQYCSKHQLRLLVGRANRVKNKKESPEQYWRNLRYGFFATLGRQVITCHNLDDSVETWLFTAMHGQSRLIPYQNDAFGIIRPFLLTRKKDLEDWCHRKGVPFLKDPSNQDTRYNRCRIRHNIVPEALKVNPGLYKVVGRLVEKEFRDKYLVE